MDQAVAVRPTTEFQDRMNRALEERQVARMEGPGSPDTIPEIQRELTMVQGAMQGVHQRLADLVAVLGPVMPSKQADAIRQIEPLRDDSFEVVTEMGRGLRGVQVDLHEVESVLSLLVHGVRL
jgi:hypothetical protein